MHIAQSKGSISHHRDGHAIQIQTSFISAAVPIAVIDVETALSLFSKLAMIGAICGGFAIFERLFMSVTACAGALLMVAPAYAEPSVAPIAPPALDDGIPTAALNSRIQANNDAIADRNKAALDAYARERARFEEAKKQNDADRAVAAAAAERFRADQAQYRANLAKWTADNAGRRGAATPPPAAVRVGSAVVAGKRTVPRDRIVCETFRETGSLVKTYRTCKARSSWDKEHEARQVSTVSNSCGKPSCDGLQ